MRMFLTAVIGWAAVGVLAEAAEERPPQRMVAVSGTAETQTAPDQIVWRIGLTDTDKILAQAKKRNDDKVKAVVALREKLGLGEGDLQTDNLSVSREFERDQHGYQREFKHFLVSRSITIRQRDLKRFDHFLDTLLAIAEMDVNYSYESTRFQELRVQTRLNAMKAAQAKAKALAETAGAKLGKILTINERDPSSSGRGWQDGVSNSAFIESRPAVDTASERFVPGAIKVQVTIYATFELE